MQSQLNFIQCTNAVDEGSQVYVYNNGPQEEDGSKGQVGKYMCNTLLLQKCACARLQVCYWVLKIEKGVVPKYNVALLNLLVLWHFVLAEVMSECYVVYWYGVCVCVCF